jgi:hypothetical protein
MYLFPLSPSLAQLHQTQAFFLFQQVYINQVPLYGGYKVLLLKEEESCKNCGSSSVSPLSAGPALPLNSKAPSSYQGTQ